MTPVKKEVDQRAACLRLCRLNPALQGYFKDDRFAEQKVLTGTLRTIADLETQAGFKSPTMIIIAEVVRMGLQIQWLTACASDVHVVDNARRPPKGWFRPDGD